MASLNGGQLIAEMLGREGVRYIFTVSGGVLNPLYKACEERNIAIVHTRHEAAAAFMADAWARTTGEPGVVAVTLGPGVTNVVTGVFTAQRATSPIIVLAGQSGQSSRDLEPGMSIDPIPIMSPVTKWAKSVGEVARVPEYVARAFHIALAGRPGPVFLEFPGNVLTGEINSSHVTFPDHKTIATRSRPAADPSQLEAAIALLNSAKRPLLIAGSGVWWSGASKELHQFVDQAEIPFFLARAGRGAIPEDHPLCFGPGYLPANPVLEEAFRNADLVLLVGHRLDFDLNYGQPPHLHHDAKIVQIDIEPSEIGRYRPAQVGLMADARLALSSMSNILSQRLKFDPRWLSDLEGGRKQWVDGMDVDASSENQPAHPLKFLKGISDILPRESVIVTSHGNIDFWADAYFKIFQPGGYIRAGQSGSLGADIPYGIAAKLARPDQPVIVIVGDGGFGYHCMELDTAARYGAPVVIAIGNDASWGAIALPQEREYGRTYATDLEFRNYEKIADVLGGYGEFVGDPNAVSAALKRALGSGLPAVLNVPISSHESRYMKAISG